MVPAAPFPTVRPDAELPRAASTGARARAFLARHPVALLVLLTPGIPEYLSGSSSVTLLLVNPALFALLLLANLGLYAPGALLVREAIVRFGRGWPSMLCLGAAYAIVEEGIALNTMFDPRASVVHSLGFYGHYLGVNWVWAVGLVMFHAVYSISLPIVLLGLAVPQSRGRSLLSSPQIAVVFAILLIDVSVLFTFVLVGLHFFMGFGPLVGSLAVLLGLCVLAVRLPATVAWRPRLAAAPSPRALAVLAATVFPATLLVQGISQTLAFPAAGTVGVLLGLYAAYVLAVGIPLGREPSSPRLVAVAAGLLAPILVFGVLASLPVPLVVGPDLLAGLFLVHLWRRATATPVRPITIPAGAQL